MAAAMTLHDFVLNLLTDQEARAAFASDPAGALQHAGLSDISAQDVQDVVPLVLDSASVAPADGLPALPAGALSAGPAGAIQQLQLVAAQLPFDDAPHMSGGVHSAGGIGVSTPDGGFSLGGGGWFKGPDGSQASAALRDAGQQLESHLQDPAFSAPRLPDPSTLAGALPSDPTGLSSAATSALSDPSSAASALQSAASDPASVTDPVIMALSNPTAPLESLPGANMLPVAPSMPDLGAVSGALPTNALPTNALPTNPQEAAQELGSALSDPTAAFGSLPGAGSLPAPLAALGSLPSGGGHPLPAIPGVDGLPGIPATGLPSLPTAPPLAIPDAHALDSSVHADANALDQAAHTNAAALDQAAHTNAAALDQAAHTNAAAFDQATDTSVNALDQAAHTSANAFDQAAHTSVSAFSPTNPLHGDALHANGLTNVVEHQLDSHLDAVTDHAPAGLPQHLDDHFGL